MPPLRRGHGTPRRAGHILNMSSYSLWMPFPGLALYSASKAYMRSFSVAFAKEVRERGIRVTALCPAGVATDLYGLTPYWQRIGRKLGVLITPRQLCAPRAEGVVERPPLHRTRLVEPRLDPLFARYCRCGCCGRCGVSR